MLSFADHLFSIFCSFTKFVVEDAMKDEKLRFPRKDNSLDENNATKVSAHVKYRIGYVINNYYTISS